ncbi:1696_t:CDS:2, partial [Paraglomus occultum]
DALDNSSRKSNSKKKPVEEQEIADKQRAELELLMDDTDEDNFEINANDPRFAALLENHHFAIDPTNPHFKKTKAMQKLLEERQRRQVLADSEEIRDQESWNTSSNTFKDASLSSLVNSVKRKTAVISEKNRRAKPEFLID